MNDPQPSFGDELRFPCGCRAYMRERNVLINRPCVAHQKTLFLPVAPMPNDLRLVHSKKSWKIWATQAGLTTWQHGKYVVFGLHPSALERQFDTDWGEKKE